MTLQTTPVGTRTVVGDISLSLDGRVTGPGGEYDMSWIVPHAVTDGARPRGQRYDPSHHGALGQEELRGLRWVLAIGRQRRVG